MHRSIQSSRGLVIICTYIFFSSRFRFNNYVSYTRLYMYICTLKKCHPSQRPLSKSKNVMIVGKKKKNELLTTGFVSCHLVRLR